MRKQYIEGKGYIVVEMWEYEEWKLYKTDMLIKQHLRKYFLNKPPLRQDQLLEKAKSGAMFGYVHCDTKFPEHLRGKFDTIPPIFKNTNVCRTDFAPLMQEYAEMEELMSQLRRMLISSIVVNNDTNTAPLLLFYLELGLVCRKMSRLV